jgi:hypothetical protein
MASAGAVRSTLIDMMRYLDFELGRVVAEREITVFDHALTRPWMVTKNYPRVQQARPVWCDVTCVEDNQHVLIGKKSFLLSADGYLMPIQRTSPTGLVIFQTIAKITVVFARYLLELPGRDEHGGSERTKLAVLTAYILPSHLSVGTQVLLVK